MVMERWRPGWTRRWRPFRELEEMERFMDESLANWPFRLTWRRVPAEEMAWAPPVEMYEKGDSFVIHAEIPGVKREEIDISVTGDTLTIKGERKAPEPATDEQYCCSEVCYGPFSRSITLPSSVDASKVDATYENGVLTLRAPKVKEAVPARIEIKAK